MTEKEILNNFISMMSTENIKKKSIVEIFHQMDYEEKTNDMIINSVEIKLKQLNLSFNEKVKKHLFLEDGIQSATKALNQWKTTTFLERADYLHKIWLALSEKSHMLVNCELIEEAEFSLIIDYFDWFSDLQLLGEEQKNWESVGIVLVVLTNETPFCILSAVVAAALAAGCSIIVQLPEHRFWFPLLLAHIFVDVGLPISLLSIESLSEKSIEFSSEKIQKAIFCGTFTEAENFYKNCLAKSMSFMCPCNTGALVLESCDLSSAVDKLCFETWNEKFNGIWTVSTVVVQESIYEKFLDKLKFRIKQILSENKDFFKFKDKTVLDKINEIKMKAVKIGATIENYGDSLNESSPTVLVNYEDPNIDPDVPILKVLICRTPKEGITLLNNCRYCSGVSIWSEILSQALEVASQLVCKNIWINNHGSMIANASFQPGSFSGTCNFGGYDGFFEYLSVNGDCSIETKKTVDDESFPDKLNVLQTALSGQNAFKKWCLEKNKRKILKELANSAKECKEFSKLYEIINYYSHSGKILNFPKNNFFDEFYLVQKKTPVGVIAIFINNSVSDICAVFSSLTIPAIAFGNAVVVVLKEKNSEIDLLVKRFNSYLPKNLLNVIIGSKSLIYLSSDPTVEVLWLYSEHLSMEYVQLIKNHAAKNLKHIWIVPKNLPLSHCLFQKECLRNKIICMTKVDQFP